MSSNNWIVPDWPAPKNIKAISTTRNGGYSLAPYKQLNLGLHVGDDVDLVLKNRQLITDSAQLPEAPRWLEQTHSTNVLTSQNWQTDSVADAMVSQHSDHVCTVMTADCLPILLCDQQGTMVAAIHAGWRGLQAGIIENTIKHFSCPAAEIMAWFGPAIGPSQFEVGEEVYQQFVCSAPQASSAFQPTDEQHYLANIYLLAKQRLNSNGISAIYGGQLCTVSDSQQFFSYRREGVTGRMATMIWLTDK